MKEHNINKLDSFIKGWYINKSICKKLIKLFEKNKSKHVNGRFRDGYYPEFKKSTDLHIYNNDPIYDFYFKELNNCIKKYKNFFPELDNTLKYWGITKEVNIQRYKPKEGFFQWHAEQVDIATSKRMLVFMTYLNTVKNDGETEWFYQKLKIKAEEGLTVIWPANWNFIHRGCISNTEKKYIITGWYEFIA